MARKKSNYSGSSVYDEAIRTLRTNILFSDIDNKLSKIVITSSIPDEGKSTIAVELSRSMAQNGSKVILLGCDLRNPTVGEYTENHVNYGITNILMKKNRFSWCNHKRQFRKQFRYIVKWSSTTKSIRINFLKGDEGINK